MRKIVDDYMLTIHPLVLGSGRRLFADEGAFAKLQLVAAKPPTTGVIIATYHSGARAGAKSEETLR
jgi:dihydrofolate reductase